MIRWSENRLNKGGKGGGNGGGKCTEVKRARVRGACQGRHDECLFFRNSESSCSSFDFVTMP